MSNQQPTYPVYRGLQKPLVFKSFKGRYIYWGLGTILIALLTAMLISSIAGIFTGMTTMTAILGAGLGKVSMTQAIQHIKHRFMTQCQIIDDTSMRINLRSILV